MTSVRFPVCVLGTFGQSCCICHSPWQQIIFVSLCSSCRVLHLNSKHNKLRVDGSAEPLKVTWCPAISILSSRSPSGYSQIIGIAVKPGYWTNRAFLQPELAKAVCVCDTWNLFLMCILPVHSVISFIMRSYLLSGRLYVCILLKLTAEEAKKLSASFSDIMFVQHEILLLVRNWFPLPCHAF